MFDQYYAPLTSFAFRFTRSYEVSKDVVQNLFIRLYQNRHSLTLQSDIKSYLYKAVYNGSLNKLKKESLRDEHHQHYASAHNATPYEQAKEETEKEHPQSRAHHLQFSFRSLKKKSGEFIRVFFPAFGIFVGASCSVVVIDL